MTNANEASPVPSDLLLEFFLQFSRFEYALKASGYTVGGPGQVCEYYVNHPPKKQVIVDGSLGWSSTLPDAEGAELVMLLVRRVRNNLFHGGKHNAGPQIDPSRDKRLIAGCLEILNECLRIADDVRAHYQAGAI